MQYVVSVYLVPGQPGAFYQFGTSRDIAAALFQNLVGGGGFETARGLLKQLTRSS